MRSTARVSASAASRRPAAVEAEVRSPSFSTTTSLWAYRRPNTPSTEAVIVRSTPAEASTKATDTATASTVAR